MRSGWAANLSEHVRAFLYSSQLSNVQNSVIIHLSIEAYKTTSRLHQPEPKTAAAWRFWFIDALTETRPPPVSDAMGLACPDLSLASSANVQSPDEDRRIPCLGIWSSC